MLYQHAQVNCVKAVLGAIFAIVFLTHNGKEFHSWLGYLINTRIFVAYGMFICPDLMIEDINIDIVECDLLDNVILYCDQYFILDKTLLCL